MAFTSYPAPAVVISSAQAADMLKDHSAYDDRWHSGFGQSSAGLTFTVADGEAYISGYKVGDEGAGASQNVSLTANATNHVFLNKLGTLSANTSGTPPADSIKLYVAVTNGSIVTGVTDLTVTLERVRIQAPFSAESGEFDGSVSAEAVLLVGTQPFIESDDISVGGGAFRLWNRNGKWQVTDASGAVIYVEDLASLYSGWTEPVIDKDVFTPPGSPATYDRYIVASGASGAWTGQVGKIAEYTGAAWEFQTPVEGWVAYVKDENSLYGYDGSTWAATTPTNEAPVASTIPLRTVNGNVRTANANPANTDEAIPIGQADARYTLAAGDAESAQDAVGTILLDSGTIDFTYDDATPTISAVVAPASLDASHLANDAVTNPKLANMAASTIKGRAVGAGTGDPTDLTAAQVVTLINTADGAGSGVDADLLDGFDTAQGAATASTIPVRTAAGEIFTATPTDSSHAANKAYVDGSSSQPFLLMGA